MYKAIFKLLQQFLLFKYNNSRDFAIHCFPICARAGGSRTPCVCIVTLIFSRSVLMHDADIVVDWCPLLATPCISKAWFVPPLCVSYLFIRPSKALLGLVPQVCVSDLLDPAKYCWVLCHRFVLVIY